MPKIITFTPNPALDVSIKIDKLIPEEKLRSDEPVREPGGGGVNVARALKKLEKKSCAIYTSGGVIGELFQKLLSEEGVGQHPFEIEGTTRENMSVLDKENNDLYRFVTPGGKLTEDEIQKLLELVNDFADADYMVASGSLPPGVPEDFYARLARKGREKDVRLILDTSGKALRSIISSGAFLIKPNKRELGDLVDRELSSEEDVKQAAREIIENNDIDVLVVSMSGEGAMLATKDGVEKLPAPQVEKKSTVGAGDSMVAGIVCKLAEGKSIKESVQYGLACGSAAIMTPGSELLRKEDADELFEKNF